MMIYGILAAFLQSIGTIFWKKSINISKDKISGIGYVFFQNSWLILIGVALSILHSYLPIFSLNIFISDYKIWLGLLIIVFLSSIGAQLSYFANKNEKISVLMPFSSLDKIFGIVLGYFIFVDQKSIITLIFGLLALGVILYANINFKKFKISKYCYILGLAGILGAINAIILGWIVIHISGFNIIIISNVMRAILLGFILYISGKLLYSFKNIPIKASNYMLFDKIFYFGAMIISLNLIKDLGVVKAMLIGMIGLIINLIFSFLFLKDTPHKKDIIVSLIVMICIFIGIKFG